MFAFLANLATVLELMPPICLATSLAFGLALSALMICACFSAENFFGPPS
jgi:hypothetical protein